ncbi:hypothetical protein NPS58_17100 [Pseudomonas putida]|uniref:hypothetical protein n=1 Tax=Pseudomonas putida TaxID=303 RepID=UPI002363F360|nr:hypothetical protein [Pseudomonas putida]MDD2059143.1 hypothetical protein [Pseudomonas putida]
MIETITLGPISGFDRFQISNMVDRQISQEFDYHRMLSFWKRLMAGDNEPEEIAQGLCIALSLGRYVRKEGAGIRNVSIQVFGEVDPKEIAKAVSGAITGSTHTGA